MGLISKLLSFSRTTKHDAQASEATADPGGGALLTCEHFADPGDDSHPVPGDYPLLVEVPRTGGAVAVGYLDPKNAQKAAQGEKRIYARDANGDTVVEMWLKADGTAVVSNSLGSITLKPDGETEVLTGLAAFIVNPSGQVKGSNPSGAFELKANGEVGCNNGSGFFKLQTDGAFNANGTVIDSAGGVVVATGESVEADSMLVDAKELKDHVHDGVEPGAGDTGPNQ